MTQLVCLRDFEIYAKQHQQQSVFGYIASGANDEQTLQDNTDAFKRLRLFPHLLQDVSKVDLSTTILGEKLSFPVALSPTAMHCLVHPHGEIATVKAAAAMETGIVLSSWSTKSMEEVADAAPGCLRWYQLYVLKDRDLTVCQIKRAEKAGYKALVVTVDNPYVGIRLADIRNRFTVSKNISLPNLIKDKSSSPSPLQEESSKRYGPVQIDPALCWKDIDWLKSQTSLPIVLKGILTEHDAIKAVEHGISGIMVSNHGARQLDGVQATIDALPEVVQAVQGSEVEVYLDCGVRLGTDVLKALALGAKAVFIGRPVLWGLTYNGEEGVKSVLEILKHEFSVAMALAGCNDAKNVPSSLVRRSISKL